MSPIGQSLVSPIGWLLMSPSGQSYCPWIGNFADVTQWMNARSQPMGDPHCSPTRDCQCHPLGNPWCHPLGDCLCHPVANPIVPESAILRMSPNEWMLEVSQWVILIVPQRAIPSVTHWGLLMSPNGESLVSPNGRSPCCYPNSQGKSSRCTEVFLWLQVHVLWEEREACVGRTPRYGPE